MTEKIRTNILTIGINELLENYLIKLDGKDDRDGVRIFEYDEKTKYLIHFEPTKSKELKIKIYWNLKIVINDSDLSSESIDSIERMLKSEKNSHDAYVMGHLYRQNDKYIQSETDSHYFQINGKKQSEIKKQLEKLPEVDGNGFRKK